MEKDKQEYLNSEYYKKIKEIFEGVEVLDGYDKQGEEYDSDEEEAVEDEELEDDYMDELHSDDEEE